MDFKELGTMIDEQYRNDLNNYLRNIVNELTNGVLTVADGVVTEKKLAPAAVTEEKIVEDTISYTRLKLASVTLITEGTIQVDYQAMKMILKPYCYVMIQNRVLNLNTTKNDIEITLPNSDQVCIVMVDIKATGFPISIEHYSTTNTANKRILCYLYKNKLFGPNVPYIKVINSIKVETKQVAQEPTLVSEHLNNPFIKTRIKLIGDSKTAGVSGTGYSPTGPPIGTTGYNMNVTTAVCWANMLRDHVLNKYNKDVDVAVNDPNITYLSDTHQITDYSNKFNWQTKFMNTSTSNGMKFTFYGDHCTIVYAKTTNSGIADILVDGSFYIKLDCYGQLTNDNELKIADLTPGMHTIEIRETNTKNAQSGANSVYIQGLKIPKTVDVINYGISGKNSQYIYQNRTQLIENDDDIIIMQIGTNDRWANSMSVTKGYHREIIKYVQGLGKKL
ncbi:SGNH/GDSL hydrolase family protein [Bacillus sp. XF8]|uniref:SGNH/GDSL hydrolase family protein n=1 Tax=Bacillus sp. XF8 TaxID=2819289 RepID=UPI001AA050FE|nr:SGNH/GDSL hydrolase family protein [Bacillus sp. XF8]MBO1582258.1 hypothetical protein [Bacillus sp. XF8]